MPSGLTSSDPLFCACCNQLLPPDRPICRVNIDALIDMAPESVEHDAKDLRREIEKTLKELSSLSAQEAMDDVTRKLTLFFCLPCFRTWIEDPAAGTRHR